MSMDDIVKAGWLYRQSSFLLKWKKSWFVLKRSGEFLCYKTQDSHEPKERKLLYAVCTGISAGEKECSYSPPDGIPPACLLMLKIKCKSGGNEYYWKLCAESTDDLYAWKISLEQARAYNPFVQNAQQGYQNTIHTAGTQQGYQHTIHTGGAGDMHVNGPQYVNVVYAPAPPPQIITVEDDPYERAWNRRYGRYPYRYREPPPPAFQGAILSRPRTPY